MNAHAVLIMDSNRRFIDPDKFWYNRTVQKMVGGNVGEATQTVETSEFVGVKHAILHIGTNDVETRKPPDLIANEIIQVALKLKENTRATTYISSLPPRADNLNDKCSQVNNHLKKSLPESIKFIDNDVNVEVNDLYDKKHLKEISVRKVVGNMKDAIRAARNTSVNQNNRTVGSISRNTSRSVDPTTPNTPRGDDRYYSYKDAAASKMSYHGGRSQHRNHIDNHEDNRTRGGDKFFNVEHSYGASNKQRENPPQQNKLDSILDVLKTFVSTVTPIIS